MTLNKEISLKKVLIEFNMTIKKNI